MIDHVNCNDSNDLGFPMQDRVIRSFLFALLALSGATSFAQGKPYHLTAVDLKQHIIWDAKLREPEGSGLAFGGQDQDSDDGRGHTHIWADGRWKSIHQELVRANPLQKQHAGLWRLRNQTKGALATARRIYFKGLLREKENELLRTDLAPQLMQTRNALAAFSWPAGLAGPFDSGDEPEKNPFNSGDKPEMNTYYRGQIEYAKKKLSAAGEGLSIPQSINADTLSALLEVQIELELAAQSLAAEPPARAMNCGAARLADRRQGPSGRTIAYDAKHKVYVIFGGDHLDYLTNDTWVFDPKVMRWYQKHPQGAPPPRANHQLAVTAEGTIRLSGGYTYSSNTGYTGGQYRNLDDGEWEYDIATNRWKGGELVAADARTYRAGPFHPGYFHLGGRPDAKKFTAWLSRIPANQWIATNPIHRPRLNRDWGTARIDPSHDLMLRFSGGHSAHGGTDVLHYHFSTNRWELPCAVEFPLGQLYSNTSYPNGYNFNLRPWITGHTYQNYEYSRNIRQMIFAGRPRHSYFYDVVRGDWVARKKKPQAMQYNNCFYTLTLTGTPSGVICWDRNGRVHRFDSTKRNWVELPLTGDNLPGAYVDNSTIAYDANRNRVLILNTAGYRKPYDGQIFSVDLKTNRVAALSPGGRKHAANFATIDKCCFHIKSDLLILGTYLKGGEDHTPTPAYDCKNNCWVTLDLKYNVSRRGARTLRQFPHTRSDGLMYDENRNLIWGTDTNSQVYVLRLDTTTANQQPLR